MVEETVVRIDGEERTMFMVNGESYSTRSKALQAAQELAPQQSTRNLSRDQPQIGDVRVMFQETRCQLVSVLAKLSSNGMLTNWRSQQGSGYDVALLHYGDVSAQDMIGSAQANNSARTWMLRLCGWLLHFIGFSMVTSIVTTTADVTLNWIPFLGPMATSIINLGVGIANFILANCVTMLVASIAWVVYRPVLGATLLVGSLGLFYATSQIGKAKGGGKVE